MKLTRRTALKNLLGGAAIVATPGGILLAQAEPVRRFWQVGANLKTGRTYCGGVEAGVFLNSDDGYTYDKGGRAFDLGALKKGETRSGLTFQERDVYEQVRHDIPYQRDMTNLKHFIHDEFIHEDMTVKEAAAEAFKQGRELHIQLVKKREPMTTCIHADGTTSQVSMHQARLDLIKAAMRFQG